MNRQRMIEPLILENDEEFILDRDYSIDGGVTMIRRDFQHGFENKEKGFPHRMMTSDQDILEEASDILLKNKRLDASDLELKVHNRIIQISGWVDSRDEKKEAERCIELVSGIKDIENLIHLRSRILSNEKGECMKTLQEIMAKKVSFATPETSLVLVAKNMISFDCGELPIVKSEKDRSVVGVVTDRDIVCRTLGQGKNPMNLFAKDCMTKEVITIDVNASIPQCIKLMRDNKIRRIPVVDKNKHLCGIVSLSDLVVEAESEETTKLFHDVSTPGHSPSALQ